jgi:hypothetical protein
MSPGRRRREVYRVYSEDEFFERARATTDVDRDLHGAGPDLNVSQRAAVAATPRRWNGRTFLVSVVVSALGLLSGFAGVTLIIGLTRGAHRRAAPARAVANRPSARAIGVAGTQSSHAGDARSRFEALIDRRGKRLGGHAVPPSESRARGGAADTPLDTQEARVGEGSVPAAQPSPWRATGGESSSAEPPSATNAAAAAVPAPRGGADSEFGFER